LELELMYRIWWYDERYVEFDGWRTQYEGTRSERQHVHAWKLHLGGTTPTRLTIGARSLMVVEGYCGIGSRWKDIRWTMHEGTLNGETVKDRSGRVTMHLPTFHWGCRIGLERTREVTRSAGP
jgi:hypothetical protein